jgi:hypothetical protein
MTKKQIAAWCRHPSTSTLDITALPPSTLKKLRKAKASYDQQELAQILATCFDKLIHNHCGK